MKKSLLYWGGVFAMLSALSLGFTACDDEDDEDDSVYALVNIPFDKFFARETTDGEFDAYTSATQKAGNGSMSYGTYHAHSDTVSELKTSGITCPVKISKGDISKLTGTEITDDSASVDITITGRGASTLRYSGKQILFDSPDYSYYLLSDAPAYYKTASVSGSGLSFGKINGTPTSLGKLYVEIKAGEAHHNFSPAITLYKAGSTAGTVEKLTFDNGETVKKVTTTDGVETTEDQEVSALKTIIATDTDGKSYGLTTLANLFWGKSQIGFQAPASEDESKNLYPQHDLVGKTIAKLTFITEDAIFYADNFEVGTVDTGAFTAADDTTFKIPNLQAQ